MFRRDVFFFYVAGSVFLLLAFMCSSTVCSSMGTYGCSSLLSLVLVLPLIIYVYAYHQKKEKVRGVQTGPSVAQTSKSGGFDFDVFLSFRGADTRQGFTSHLYKELNRLGLVAFIDSEDLQKGEKISDLFRYMEASQNFLPILSKNYAQSKWCLSEAVKMVDIFEAARGEKRWILPVFYDIDPSELKGDKGSFQVAITEHLKKRKLNKKEEEEYRGALRTIGRIYGFGNRNRNDAELISCICKRVKELLPKVPFNTLAIGIDSRVHEVIDMLERGGDSVCMIGIWGMGGIGKTTIAKVIYDRLCNKFEGSSFISDVRETAKNQGLPSLQAKLLRNVLNKENVSIGTVEEGWNMIKQRLRRKRVFIVLDDIDHNDQLNALVGDQVSNRLEDLFGTGSKIIVTTRDKAVLSRQGLKAQHGEERIYHTKELEHPWSLKLFRLHAFKYEPPTLDFLELSKQVVEITGGLPLALVVFGAHFAGLSTKEEWEEDMKKLRKDRLEDVLVRLKLSYDGLDFGQQQVFLDIACFLIGSKKEYATYVWEDSQYSPGNAIRVLQEKSLLSFDDKGKFSMHDQIRDMGRWIVKKEGKHDPALYSRLWEKADILKVLEDERGSGKEKIQSIDLSYPAWGGNQHQLWHDVFAPMSDLRILRINNCGSGGRPLKLPKNMRWLQIQNSSFERRDWMPNFIPLPPSPLEAEQKQAGKNSGAECFRDKVETKPCDDEFNLEKLIVLQLRNCDMPLNNILLTKRVFKSLKVLEANCSDLVKSLDFSLMPSLVKLLLDYSWSLDKIDDSVGNLSKLELLSLRHCESLKELPNSICKLTCLQSLNLEGCEELYALPQRLGDLTMLRELILDECRALEAIPDSIAQLNQLHHFSAQVCRKIRTFPQLPSSLLTLYFSGFSSVSVISDISTLKYLKELVLDGFWNLVEVPESIGCLEKLEVLSLRECKRIKELPSNICQSSSLQKLDLMGCLSISALPEKMGELAALGNLNLELCRSLREIPNSIANLHRLQVLNVRKCDNLQHLPKLPSSLVTLDASYCDKLKQVSDLSNLKDLDELDLKGCRSLVDVPALENLDSLRVLRLHFCECLSPSLGARLIQARFEHLKEFVVAGIHEDHHLSFLLPNSSTIHELRLYLEKGAIFARRVDVPIQVVSHGGEPVLQTVRCAQFSYLDEYSISLGDDEVMQRHFRDGYRKIRVAEFINGVHKLKGGYVSSFWED